MSPTIRRDGNSIKALGKAFSSATLSLRLQPIPPAGHVVAQALQHSANLPPDSAAALLLHLLDLLFTDLVECVSIDHAESGQHWVGEGSEIESVDGLIDGRLGASRTV